MGYHWFGSTALAW